MIGVVLTPTLDAVPDGLGARMVIPVGYDRDVDFVPFESPDFVLAVMSGDPTDDKQRQIYDAIGGLDPQAFVIEHARGLAAPRQAVTLKLYVDQLQELGYHVDYDILPGPKGLKRTWIIGNQDKAPQWPSRYRVSYKDLIRSAGA